jgi:flagellar hook-length control protein FliK
LAQAMPQLAAASQSSASVALPVAEEPAGVNLFSAMQMPVADSATVTVAVPVSPYTYAGRLQEDGRWTVFLTDGQQQYVLHEGDRFAEGWKVAVLDQQKVILQHAAERFEIRLDNGLDNGVVF